MSMKKNILIVVLTVFLCASLLTNGYTFVKQLENKDVGAFKTGDQYGQYDSHVEGFSFKIDKKTALKLGNVILQQRIFGDKMYKETQYVVEEYKDYYIVSRFPKHPANGGDYLVAINKKDGKILSIWGEL